MSGHVDGVGQVVRVDLASDDIGGSQRWTFRVPAPLARYIAVKGSVCVDGTTYGYDDRPASASSRVTSCVLSEEPNRNPMSTSFP